RRLGRRDPDPRAERLALRAGGVPPPRDRVDDHRRRGHRTGARGPPAFGGGARELCARPGRRLRLPLLRPRHGADLRPHLAARGGAAPVRRLGLLLAVLAALAAPASALAHASLRATAPSYRERVQAAPGAVRLRFDQPVTA